MESGSLDSDILPINLAGLLGPYFMTWDDPRLVFLQLKIRTQAAMAVPNKC